MEGSAQVASVSTAQMREIDRAMIEDLGIGLLQMMEHAGRHLAHLTRERFLASAPHGRSVLVLAGSGGNGGGALTAARRLHAWGASVHAFTTVELEALSSAAAHQAHTLQRMGVPLAPWEERDASLGAEPDVIVDGVIGYGLVGAPERTAAAMIRWMGRQGVPVVSLDVPSGLNATTGEVSDAAVRATATLALALPKHGVLATSAREHVGELYVGDIGVPPALYETVLGSSAPRDLFARSDLVRVR